MLGSLNIQSKLGIANLSTQNPYQWVQDVLRPGWHLYFGLVLPSPIYQQQLVHNNQTEAGPGVAAEAYPSTYSPNSEAFAHYTLREVSAHHSKFSRINISTNHINNPTPTLNQHRVGSNNKMYYVGNEPETLTQQYGTVDGHDPFNLTTIDSQIASYFNAFTTANGNNSNMSNPMYEAPFNGTRTNYSFKWSPYFSFWREGTQSVLKPGKSSNSQTPSDYNFYLLRGISAQALAFVYMFTKWQTEPNSTNIVLPPSLIAIKDYPTSVYWQTFFNTVKNGISFQHNGSPVTLVYNLTTDLRALHTHQYTGWSNSEVNNPSPPTSSVLQHVIGDIQNWIAGIELFKTHHYGSAGNTFNQDMLFSEIGPFNHFYDPQTYPQLQKFKWTGGFRNIRRGLTCANTYIGWLMRHAEGRFNINTATNNRVYACVHQPRDHWFVESSDTSKTQPYVQLASLSSNWVNSSQSMAAKFMGTPGDTVDSDLGGRYQACFATLGSPNSNGRVWHMSPLGATLATWAQIGADNASQWWGSSSTGTSGDQSIRLFAGFNTLFFVVNKINEPASDVCFDIQWKNPNGTYTNFGKLRMSDFEGINGGNPQQVYPYMIFPITCYIPPALGGLTQYIRLSRTGSPSSGGYWYDLVYVSRPVSFPGAHSWLSDQ